MFTMLIAILITTLITTLTTMLIMDLMDYICWRVIALLVGWLVTADTSRSTSDPGFAVSLGIFT